jgi:hypothetical protein
MVNIKCTYMTNHEYVELSTLNFLINGWDHLLYYLLTLEVPDSKCTTTKRLGTRGKKNSITGEKNGACLCPKQAVKEV